MDDLENSMEQPETVEPFEINDDSADIVMVIGEKKLYCHSIFLRRISSTFFSMVQRNESNEERVVVKMDNNVCYSDIIKILKFYYKNHDFAIKGNAVNTLLNLYQTCDRFDCRKMKYMIYDFLDKGNDLKEYFQNRLFPTTSQPSTRYQQIANNVASPEIKRLLTKPGILSSFGLLGNAGYGRKEIRNETVERIAKLELDTSIKFELLMYMLQQSSSLESYEKIALINYLKIYFYENRTADLSLSNLSTHERVNLFIPDFLPISPPGDCKVKVEGHTLVVSSIALSVLSPVFKAMLNSSFKEGTDKIIEFPGKRLEEIIELMNHIHHPMEIDEKSNIMGLLSLSREYQIDWLTEKIKKYMFETATISTDLSTLLTYLSSAENYGFQRLKDRIYEVADRCNFTSLQMMEEFNLLTNETQLEFVCNVTISSNVHASFADYLLSLIKGHHSTINTPTLQCLGKRKRDSSS